MSDPNDKPGRLAIVFFDNADNALLQNLIAVAEGAGYTIDDQNQNSVLLERGY